MAINRNKRILNVQIALQEAGTPLTATEIIERVPEYLSGEVLQVQPRITDFPERIQHAARVAFDEDKRALKALGVELVKSGGGATTRYGLKATELGQRAEILLDPAESAMIQAAAWQWKDAGRMAALARRGMTKVLGVGSNPDALETSTLGQLVPDSEHFFTIFESWTARHVIEFEYRRSNSFVSERRRVHPWLVTLRDRRWVLVGFDELRQAERQFLLRRITSEVVVDSGVEFVAPEPEFARQWQEQQRQWSWAEPTAEQRKAQLQAVIAVHTSGGLKEGELHG